MVYLMHGKWALCPDKKRLKQDIYENECIVCYAFMNGWFQMKYVDVLTSHSHRAIQKAMALAEWLYDTY